MYFTAYVQEIGRCGRDGEPSTAILFYNSTDISTNKEHLQTEMKDYVKNDEKCRRQFLLEYFGFSAPATRDKHLCCDICRNMCKCVDCSLAVQCSEETINCPKFSKKQVDTAKHLLTQYFHAENSIVEKYVVPHLHTGLSDSLATSLASKPMYKDQALLSKDFPLLKDTYISNISLILSQVLTMHY